MGQAEVIAGRYARGLAEDVAESGADFARVRRDLSALAGMLDSRSGGTYVAEFDRFLTSPTATAEEKVAAAAAVADKLAIGDTARNFLAVLIRHGRSALLPRAEQVFRVLADDMTGERSALVETARPLDAGQAERLTRALTAALAAPVRLHQRVVPELLAGARVTVGDTVWDESVLGKLHRLENHLLTSGVEGALATVEEGGAIACAL